MTTHVNWTDIENFHSLRRGFAKYPHLLEGDPSVTYRAKVKVHGTNAGVRIDPDGTVTALSRSSVITLEKDNAGFARWVAERSDAFASLARNFTIVVFGEWCGPGIQKGVAVCGIPKKVFAVFGIRVPEADGLAAEPAYLHEMVGHIPDVHVIPWFNDGETFTVDWTAEGDALQPVLDAVNARVSEVETEDPWVSSTFGVKGLGEGLVFYPTGRGDSYKAFSSFVFKAKGEKHNTVARTKPAQASATSVEALADFVDLVLTEARLEQGLSVVGGADPKKMGDFLKWVNGDLVKETAAELEASKLPPKEAYRACTNHARDWFLLKTKQLG